MLLALLLLLVVSIGDLNHSPGWLFLVVTMLLAVGLIFGSLTVVIADGVLHCWLGIGLFRRRFELRDITAAEIVRNHWYYGWGIRLTPNGWMFNVNGLDAVEITLSSGKMFRIGTDRPQQLAQIIQAHI